MGAQVRGSQRKPRTGLIVGYATTDRDGELAIKPAIIVEMHEDNVADLSVFDADIKGSEAVTKVPLGNEETARSYWVLEG